MIAVFVPVTCFSGWLRFTARSDKHVISNTSTDHLPEWRHHSVLSHLSDVTYTCLPGHFFHRDVFHKTITCDADGVWKQKDKIKPCVRKHYLTLPYLTLPRLSVGIVTVGVRPAVHVFNPLVRFICLSWGSENNPGSQLHTLFNHHGTRSIFKCVSSDWLTDRLIDWLVHVRYYSDRRSAIAKCRTLPLTLTLNLRLSL